MNEPEWVLKAVVLALHAMQLAEHGGQADIRDESLLESALAKPPNLFAHVEPQPDLCSLAASYAYGLAKNHPFLDGNKRASLITAETFLELNGLAVTASEAEKVTVWPALAAGEMDQDQIAAWFRTNTAAP